jgi:hypothetical protein
MKGAIIIIVQKCNDKPKPARPSGWHAYQYGKNPPVESFAKTRQEAVTQLADKIE